MYFLFVALLAGVGCSSSECETDCVFGDVQSDCSCDCAEGWEGPRCNSPKEPSYIQITEISVDNVPLVFDDGSVSGAEWDSDGTGADVYVAFGITYDLIIGARTYNIYDNDRSYISYDSARLGSCLKMLIIAFFPFIKQRVQFPRIDGISRL